MEETNFFRTNLKEIIGAVLIVLVALVVSFSVLRETPPSSQDGRVVSIQDFVQESPLSRQYSGSSLGDDYFKTEDGEIVFKRYGWAPIELKDADPESFETLTCRNCMGGGAEGYAKDSDHLYKDGKIVEGIHPAQIASFDAFGQLLASTSPWRDAVYVVIHGHKVLAEVAEGLKRTISDADPATFSVIEWPYAKDASGVYYMDKRIVGANADTFGKVPMVIPQALSGGKYSLPYRLEGHFFQDNKAVYVAGTPIYGIDASPTLVAFPFEYLKDGENIFFISFGEASPVRVDPESFEILWHSYTKDAQGEYLYGMPLDELGVDFVDTDTDEYYFSIPSIVAPQAVPTSFIDTSSWSTFRLEKYGIEFGHPGSPENIVEAKGRGEGVSIYLGTEIDPPRFLSVDVESSEKNGSCSYKFSHNGYFFSASICDETFAAMAGTIKLF